MKSTTVKNTQANLIAAAESRRELWLFTVIGLVGTVLLWWLITEGPIALTRLVAGPVEVLTAGSDIGPLLIKHVLTTLLRVVVGFLAGCLAGIVVGLLITYYRPAFLLLSGVVEAMRPVPPVALVPFFLLVFGFSEIGRLLLVTLGTGLVVVVAFVEACRDTPRHLVESFQTLGYTKAAIFRHIIVPSALSKMLGPARVALALSVSLVVVSEFMGAQLGLGYVINVAKVTFSTATILLATSLLGLSSGLLDAGLRAIFRWSTPWADRLDSREVVPHNEETFRYEP